MNVSAIIKIEGVDYASLYKHNDGYPSATYGFLKEFNKDFEGYQHDQPAAKFAQLLRASMKEGLDHGWDPSRYTGWAVLPFSSDEDETWVYTLTLDGTVLINGLTEYHARNEYADID